MEGYGVSQGQPLSMVKNHFFVLYALAKISFYFESAKNTGEKFLLHEQHVFIIRENLRSKVLNVCSKALNVRSKLLNGGSILLNGDFPL